MVAGQATQGVVGLGEHRLLNSSMPEGMEGVQGGVQLHLLEPEFEPLLEFVVQHRSHFALVVPGMEQGLSLIHI